MRILYAAIVAGALAFGTLGTYMVSPGLSQTSMEKSLYERLGGYEAISAVVHDFAGKLFVDTEVGPFFKGMGADTRKSFIQKNINLVCSKNEIKLVILQKRTC